MNYGFAENLKRIRLEKQMSQEDFAKLLKTSKQNISRYESGAVSPKISTAARFAEILGVSLSELNGDAAAPVSHASASSGQSPDVNELMSQFVLLSPEQKRQILDYAAFLIASRGSDSAPHT